MKTTWKTFATVAVASAVLSLGAPLWADDEVRYFEDGVIRFSEGDGVSVHVNTGMAPEGQVRTITVFNHDVMTESRGTSWVQFVVFGAPVKKPGVTDSRQAAEMEVKAALSRTGETSAAEPAPRAIEDRSVQGNKFELWTATQQSDVWIGSVVSGETTVVIVSVTDNHDAVPVAGLNSVLQSFSLMSSAP